MEDLNDLLLQRRGKVADYQRAGVNPFANDFRVTATAQEILTHHRDDDKHRLEELDQNYQVAGRIMARRDFGKAAFVQLQDGSARIQVYIARNQIGDAA